MDSPGQSVNCYGYFFGSGRGFDALIGIEMDSTGCSDRAVDWPVNRMEPWIPLVIVGWMLGSADYSGIGSKIGRVGHGLSGLIASVVDWMD